MTYTRQFLDCAARISAEVDDSLVERIVDELVSLRERGGRLFLVGVGGGAANCSHAVNDFRKLAGIEAYSPCDNVAELTARANDEGWDTIFSAWLRTSNFCHKDMLFVLSVGGGSEAPAVSVNLVRAVEEAKRREGFVAGIVGRDGGFTKKAGDAVVVVPVLDPESITPHTESFQSLILHCIVSHPNLIKHGCKWENLKQEKMRC